MNDLKLLRGTPTAICLLGSLTLAVAQTPPGFSALLREMDGKPLPRLENGALCGVEPTSPRIYATTGNGASMFSAEISIDGATGLLLTSCAASKEGKFAVSGGAFDSRGQAVSFIAFLDNTGRTQKVQRQSNFAITRLHFDGDSRLWAVGSAPAMMRKKGDPMDLLVRVFTAEGTLTESIDIPYAYDSGKLYRPAIASHVGSTGKGLVILSPYWRELIFVAPGGGEVKKRSFEDPPNTRMITGFAVSGASIFISVQGKDPSGGPRNVYSIHRWNDASGNWDKADFGSPTGQHAILGALDDKLLAYTRSDVLWLPVAAQLSPQ